MLTIILIHGGMAVAGMKPPLDPWSRKYVYVCICNGVTEKDVRQAAVAGCRSLSELTMRTGCGATCGTCLDTASQVLREAQPQMPARMPIELSRLSNAA